MQEKVNYATQKLIIVIPVLYGILDYKRIEKYSEIMMFLSPASWTMGNINER